MKKIIVIVALFLISSVYALTNEFKIDTSKLSFKENSKKSSIASNFDSKYDLQMSITDTDKKLEEEIKEITKKTTYLLLGKFNNVSEKSEEYYLRHSDYLDLRYNPQVPKDPSTFTGLDEKSVEYKDDLVSGISVPGMFLKFTELDVIYNTFGNIRVTKTNNAVLSVIYIPNVSIKSPSVSNPMEYERKETNLVIYYYFKEIDGQYKLYYLMGETSDDLNEYLDAVESNETTTSLNMAPTYNSSVSDIYSYAKLKAITDNQIKNIYNTNVKNIVSLNSYYNNYSVSSANGFFINEGLIITTWSFIEKSLKDAQYISIKDSAGNTYEIDGIVTANPETDVVVIKLKEKINIKIALGDSSILKTEDPVLSISSKTGVGLTTQGGIVIANNGYIESTIPLSINEEGSPLFDINGKVIGMNTAKQINTAISLALNSSILKEIQDKFSNANFEEIKTISFTELKEKYFYNKYDTEEVVNSISKKKWEKYSKIGNLNENVKLELIKSSEKDGVISLRYKNGISEYIDNMQLASPFKIELKKEGYKEILNSSKKSIYRNDKYQIVIISEFDYLVIIMVELWWIKH